MIDAQLATQIVQTLKSILNENINFMDRTGMIIASTDETRCGTFHAAAAKVIADEADVLIERDDEYEGARRGANMPIRYEGNVIGVVGITGDISIVGKYAKILQQMTEILIKESFVMEILNEKYENFRRVIREFLTIPSRFEDRFVTSKILDIMPSIPRVILFSRLTDESVSYLSIYRKLDSVFADDAQSVYSCGRNSIVILATYTTDQHLDYVLNRLQSELLDLGIVHWGKSQVVYDVNDYRDAMHGARQAYLVACTENAFVQSSENMVLSLLYTDLPRDLAERYLTKVIGNLTDEERIHFGKILAAYTKHNGSLIKASEELFIHKNTLQYQLAKLAERTGYDPKNYKDFVSLYIAFRLLAYME